MKHLNFLSIEDLSSLEYTLDGFIYKISNQQISLWDGYVMGGGVGLSINSRVRIVTENTIFSMPETSIGLFNDIGSSFWFGRMFNNNSEIGIYFGLTGLRLKGKEVVYAGIGTHFVKYENFVKLRQFLENEKPNSIEEVEEYVNSICELRYSPEIFKFNHFYHITKVFKLDSFKQIMQRIDHLIKHSDNSDEKHWACDIKSNLTRKSFIAMVVVVEMVKRGMSFTSILEAYELEKKLGKKFVYLNDLREGIRALIIEKDQKPKWEHHSLDDLNEGEIIRQIFDS